MTNSNPRSNESEPRQEARQAFDALGEAAVKMRDGVREAGYAAKERLSEHASGAGSDVRESASHAQAAASALASTTRDYVTQNPGTALAAAFFGGVILAVLLRR